MFKTGKSSLKRDDGFQVEAYAPVIISASIVTDIPAYHSDWFIERIKAGYAVRTNVFSHKKMFVSFQNARLVVFWTKNAAPIMSKLHDLDDRSLGYFFHFTLNDYEREGLEPGLPSLESRVEIFQQLASLIGKEKVIWRFDPLVLTDQISPERLVEKIEAVAERLQGYTEKVVFKFAEIERHRKVAKRMTKEGWRYRDFSQDEVCYVASEIARIGKRFGMEARTCMDGHDLTILGIHPNRCVDPDLIRRVFGHDADLLKFVDKCSGKNGLSPLKNCNCLPHTDIGEYNTCLHFCRYCYANFSDRVIQENFKSRLSGNGESMLK